jgi:hypothetical protein
MGLFGRKSTDSSSSDDKFDPRKPPDWNTSPFDTPASISTAEASCTLIENPWVSLMVPGYKSPWTEDGYFDWDADPSISTEPLSYRQLSNADAEIRLLTLQEDPNGSPIRCKLEQVSLFDSPSYHALSYTWGDPGKTSPIIVNGHRFEATVNLKAALQILRAKGHKKLWIDAICINQTDREEQSQQVLRMRSVYARAARVVVWLGPESSNSNLAFELLEILSKPTDHGMAPTNNYKVAIKERSIHAPPGMFAEAWKAFDDFFKREYWKRVWIIQELAVNKDIHLYCGNRSLTWTDLESAFWHDNSVLRMGNQQIFEEFPRNTGELFDFFSWRKAMNSGDARPLLKAIVDSRRSKATNPRDHIYSLLGLASDGQMLVPIPNYKLPVSRVFTEVTTAMINATENLDIICLQGPKESNLENKPSWVPDFSQFTSIARPWQFKTVLETEGRFEDPLAINFHPFGNTYRWSIEENILTVSGRVWGIIDALSTSSDGKSPQGDIEQSHVECRPAYPTNEDTAQALGQLLTMPSDFPISKPTQHLFPQLMGPLGENIMKESYPFLHRWLSTNGSFRIFGDDLKEWTTCEFEEGFREKLSRLTIGSKRRAAQEEKLLTEQMHEYMREVELVLKSGMRIATTHRGHVGLVHPLAKKGDRICLLENMKTMVVLRPCTDDDFSPDEIAKRKAMEEEKKQERFMIGQTIETLFSCGYRVVGEAYGQGVVTTKKGKIQGETINTCPFFTFFIH